MRLVSAAVAASALFGAAAASKRQVFVLRHCLRATDTDDKIRGYSAAPVPEWGVPALWCTAQGLSVIGDTGAELVRSFGVDPSRLSLTSDTVMRTGDTAFALARGMGLHGGRIEFSDATFSALHGGNCTQPEPSVVARERLARFASVPLPWNFSDALDELQLLVGRGERGPIAALGGLAHDGAGVPVGSALLLTDFAQAMFYANASGIPFTSATREQLYRFIAWQHWYRSVKDVTSEYAADNAHLLYRILSDLAAPGVGTSIYAGHDGNMDGLAAILNLTWEAPPYMGGQLLPTPPGSGLLFEYAQDLGAVEISYVYHAFNEPGPFRLSRSKVASAGSLQDLAASAVRGLKARSGAYECFLQARAERGALCWHLSDCASLVDLCCTSAGVGGRRPPCCDAPRQTESLVV